MSVSRGFTLSLTGLTAAITIGALSLTATSANAQGRRDFCDGYARQAVEQNDINERRNCGLKGSRWSENRAAHFGWCMLFPKQAEKEADARKDELKDCRDDRRADRRDDNKGDRVGKRANCDAYAKIATVQAEANQKYNCGLRGGEWNTEERAHFRWCMKSRRAFLADEFRYRSGELQKCFDKLGDYDDEGNDKDYRRRKF